MADQTYGTIVPLATARVQVEIAGEASLANGDWVYRKSADNKVYKAQSDGTAEEARALGMVVYGGSTSIDDPVPVQVGGPVDFGVTLTEGPLVLSNNAGKVCPPADLSVGNYQTQVGYNVADGQHNMLVNPTGYVIA